MGPVPARQEPPERVVLGVLLVLAASGPQELALESPEPVLGPVLEPLPSFALSGRRVSSSVPARHSLWASSQAAVRPSGRAQERASAYRDVRA